MKDTCDIIAVAGIEERGFFCSIRERMHYSPAIKVAQWVLEDAMFNRYFDDINVGDKAVSRGRTITETDIVNFAMFSGDWFPLHSDAEYARKTMFGGRLAHGLLILSVASGLVMPEAPYTIAFYGMDRVRFINPTRIGDTIYAEAEVIEKEERNEQSGIITYRQTVKNQRGEEVVVGIMKVLMARPKLKQKK